MSATFNNFAGLKVLIVGLERSGAAAAELLTSRGAEVTGVDAKREDELLTDINRLRRSGIEIFTRDNSIEHLKGVELAVVSPGIPLEHPLIQEAKKRGIPVLSEMETAYRLWNKPVIAVTGTNGKSTTTALIGHILKTAGLDCRIAGNIGLPFSAVVDEGGDAAVVEVSSYQLETVDLFKPDVAVWLNLTPDHLSRHGDIQHYAEVKARIFRRQIPGDSAVFNAGDPMVKKITAAAKADLVPFGYSVKTGVFVKNESICIEWAHLTGAICSLERLLIRGGHNVENALAASAATAAFGIDLDHIREGLETFKGLEHRQEAFLRHEGRTFVDDSKATSLQSTLKALETLNPPLILIAGGLGKGESYEPARDLVKERVKLLITIGKASREIEKALSGAVEMISASGMPEAVIIAVERAVPGDTVLLSPMCASFDMFRDFEERGRVFKELVRSAIEEKTP